MFRVREKFALAVVALGALTSGSFGVAAQTAERAADIPSVTVRYDDLNLNTPAGVDALYARLRAAARQVCNVGQGRSLIDQIAAKACYRQALGTAVDDAKLPTLTHRVEGARVRRS
jgi:UrcA family protein